MHGRLNLQDAALAVIRRLRAAGFEALLAGGCVRDMLLGRAPKDYDVATNARPEEVVKLFPRTLKVGAKFGVVIVLIYNQQIEVATFRQDLGYKDGRRPAAVSFSTARQDALRRDFTINGMFYDPLTGQTIDYVGGRKDLAERLIRTIGPPDERFSEDYLRMLRAVRFSCQLGFAIEPRTRDAIYRNADRIIQISGERMSMELEGILTCRGRAAGLAALIETGLARAMLPGLSQESLQAGVLVVGYLPSRASYPLGLAGMLAFCSTAEALKALQVLRLSRSQLHHMGFLLDNRGQLLRPDLSLGQLRLLVASPHFWDLFRLQWAVQKATKGPLQRLVHVRGLVRQLAGGQVKPRPLLDGHDLMRLGVEPGPMLGRIAERLYLAQLDGLVRDRADATRYVIELMRELGLT